MRFEILAGDTVIGHSELERGDAPMGVAGGVFVPSNDYGLVQAECLGGCESSQDHLDLSARLVGGQALPVIGGVQVVDFSEELGPTGREVHVVGIPYPLYQKIFPNHVEAYAKQFENPG